MSLRDISPQGGERLKTLDKQKIMYNNNTYINNTHKKMYQNNYTNIPEQYINIIKNGPDGNTVIRGYHVNGVDGMLEIWIKPKIIIGIDAKEVNKMRLAVGNYIVIPSTQITEDFGSKWISTFKKLFPEWY